MRENFNPEGKHHTEGMIEALDNACFEMSGVLAHLKKVDPDGTNESLAELRAYVEASYGRLYYMLKDQKSLLRVIILTEAECNAGY